MEEKNVAQNPPINSTQNDKVNQAFHVQQSSSTSKISRLFLISGIIILLVSLTTGAYYLGTKQSKDISLSEEKNISVSPQSSESKAIDKTKNPNSVGNSSQINKTVTPSLSNNKTIIVPSTWKQYTAEDWQFKVKSTMSMPPGYSFKFTGSEFTIASSDGMELWDYSTSVYIKELETISSNHYDGSSRRTWYENYLAERQKNFEIKDKILSVSEIPLNNTSYLSISVETSAYNDRGEMSGKKTVTHYLYVQNNIVNIITPISIRADSSDAEISKNIETIFASLISQQTN